MLGRKPGVAFASVADGHDEDIAYGDVVVAGAAVDLDASECWTLRDGDVTHYYAKGPCPGCRAASQGHIEDASAPIESLGRREDQPPRPSEPVEVPLRCTCGSSHARDGATGCGRRWSIVCPREQP